MSLRVRRALAPIASALVTIACLGLLADLLRSVVDAAWFGLETNICFGSEATSWVSIALAATICYWSLLVFRKAIGAGKIHQDTEWVLGYLNFSMVVYSVIATEFVSIVEVTGGSISRRNGEVSALIFYVSQVILVSSLAALGWVLAFDLSPYRRPARQIFLLGVVVLSILLIALEGGILDLLATVFRVSEPPVDLALTGDFLKRLPYLLPIAPLLWLTWHRVRRPHEPDVERR